MQEEHLTVVNGEADASWRINQAIVSLADGGCLRLEGGNYYLRHPLEIKGKHGITLEASGATLVCHYDAEAPLTNSSEAIHVTDSSEITIRGCTITTSSPIAMLSTVTAVGEDHIIVDIDNDYAPTHHEHINNAIAFRGDYLDITHIWPEPHERDGSVIIANEITTTNSFTGLGLQHEWLGERTLKLMDIRAFKYLSKLTVGCRCSLDFSYYGLCAMVFRNATEVRIEEVTIPRFGGMGFVILPRCRNFTFKHVVIAQPSTEEAFDSLASDGIHTIGLGGSLAIIGCTFKNTRDDPLNLHTQFLTVTNVKGKCLHIVYDKKHGNVSADWGRKGDQLRVYDPVTCAPKGMVTVETMTTLTGENGRREAELTLASCGCNIVAGDLLANMAFFADLLIDDCKVESYRRGFVIQSANSAIVRNCEFIGGTMNVYISANYGQYLEAGHVSNAIVEDNVFMHCCRENVILVRAGGPGTLGPGNSHNVPTPVHRSIAIRNNRFMDNVEGVQINANSTVGLTIEGNHFCKCGEDPIAVRQCSDVTIARNEVHAYY